MSRHIAVIGAGFTGLATASNLTESAIPYTLYEEGADFSQLGYGIALGPQVEAFMTPQLRKCYESCATFDESAENHGTWLKFRCGMEKHDQLAFAAVIADVKVRDVHGKGGRSCVHRQTLLREMTRLIPPGVTQFNKRLERLEPHADGVHLFFRDGTTVDASAVLACDGIHSTVRKMMFPNMNVEPVFSGAYCYRGIFSVADVTRILSPELAQNGNIFCGDGGYKTIYPIGNVSRNGHVERCVNVVAIRRTDEEWPYHRGPVSCSKSHMLQEFEGWASPLRQLLMEMEDEVVKWPVFEAKPLDSYFSGRICLLGDAAHASAPHQGSGAGMGFEDAYVMGQLLSLEGKSVDFLHVFSRFDALRHKRTQDQVTTAREALKIYMLSPEASSEDIAQKANQLRNRLHWIFDERPAANMAQPESGSRSEC